MRKRKHRSVGWVVVLGMMLVACRTRSPALPPASTQTTIPSAPDATSSVPASLMPTEVLPTPTAPSTPTPAPPTPTPLPTWPERWEPSGGPYGGFIETIVVSPADPNTLYAAGLGGAIYTSRDGGETWAPGKRLVAPSCSFSSLIVDATNRDVLYAVNSCAGILESSDAGSSWSSPSGGIEGAAQILVQSPHAPGLLLATDHAGRVYRSRDGAVSWESISDGLPGDPIGALAASGPDLFWATTSNGHNGTLYRFNAGFWSAVPFGHPPGTETTSVLVDPADPATLFIGLASTQNATLNPDSAYLFRSTDTGFHWAPVPSIPSPASADSQETGPYTAAYVLGKSQLSGLLYVTTSDELLASPDGGDTWNRIGLPGGILAAHDLRKIAIDPLNNNVLYAPLRSAGISKSDDGGQTWRPINRGLNSLAIALISTHPSDPAILYAAPAEGLGVFKSTDYGDSWAAFDGSEPDHPTARRAGELILDPHEPETLYQATDTARVFRSTDGGATWATAWPEFRFSSIYSLAIAPSDPSILYANKSGFGIFRSDDSASSWRFLSEAGIDYTYALAIHPDNPDFVLSGHNRKPSEISAGLRRSKDGGLTWDVALELPNAAGITAVAFDPRVEPYFSYGKRPPDPTRLYAASVGPRGILWFSNDAGDSFKPLNDDLNFTNVNLLTAAPHRSGVVYAGVWGGGTWRTDDSGQSWQRLPGDPATSAVAIVVDPSNHNIVYIADGTTPHLYRSIDDGNSWQLLFDGGSDYDRLDALALAPSDPSILYLSAARNHGDSEGGAVFRIDANAPPGENANNITNNLPGIPSSLAVHRRAPHRIFAVVPFHGVWKSVDDGASWRQVQTSLTGTSFAQVVMDPVVPGTIFLLGSDLPHIELYDVDPNAAYGIWKSTDDGNTWSKVGGATFGRSSGPIKSVAFHPEDERVMYAAGANGVYLSPDRGETWTSINGRLPYIPMNAIATDGQTLYAGSAGAGVFAGAIHPLIHTADWMPESRLSAPIHHIQLTLHPSDPQTLYASAYPGGVFKTTDGGATWHARNLGLPSFAVADASRQGYYALASAPSAPEVLYVGLYGQGVFRSDDAGASWHPVPGEQDQLRTARVQAVLIHPDDPNVAYVATQDGVWRTVNGGRSWGEFSQGLVGADVRALALGNEGQLYAGSRGYGVFTRSAFHQAEDDNWWQLPELGNWGATWPLLDNQPLYQHTSLLVQPSDPNSLYAGTFPAGVFKTTDGGLVWREINVGFENDGVLVLVSHPTNDQALFAGTTNGIARSIDGGATWHPWDAGWPLQQRTLSIAFDTTNPDVIYACSMSGTRLGERAGTVMKSTDGGANWFEITTGLDPNQVFLKVLVYRFDANIVYLETQQDGVYISHDGGGTWSSWNEGLWNRMGWGEGHNVADALEFSADGRLLYLGTADTGVWRRPAEGAP